MRPIPPLLLDLYELTMAQSYFNHEMGAPATFSLYIRHLPPGWGYFLAAGLDDVLDYLADLALSEEDIVHLESTGLFTGRFLAWLRGLRFTGSVRALPEGTACFPDEPLLEVTAPLVEAQIVETIVVNQIHLQTLIASKAARCVAAAQGRRLIDFGLRRSHGTDAGLKAARSSYLAGFDSTSNVLAGRRYGIPIAGTMAHSYVQAFPDELTAFRAYARDFPDACTLLIDTYDTFEGARRAAAVGRELAASGHQLRGVRLDSGDLVGLGFGVRRILDEAGLARTTLLASGSVDEHLVARAARQGAPIDAFGVGTKMGVSADAPYLDMAYKLVAYDGRPALKLSTGKATWPGAKQVWRFKGGHEVDDIIGLAGEPRPPGGEALLARAMEGGRRLSSENLAESRRRAGSEMAALPASCRTLESPQPLPVRFSERLLQLRRELTLRAGQPPELASGRERDRTSSGDTPNENRPMAGVGVPRGTPSS